MKRFALEVVRPSLEAPVKQTAREDALILTTDICARRSRKLIDTDAESGVGSGDTPGPEGMHI
jgi:hypothetical protein